MAQRDPQAIDEHYRSLTERARIEGLSVWLELLRDRLRWNEAPAWAQDQAILAVAKKIGPAFQFVNTDIYECGGQSHRIASFRYLGANPPMSPLSPINPLHWVFRLIPGGTFTMGSPDTDEMAADNEKPTLQSVVAPLLVAATPTTQAMWLAFDLENPSHLEGEELPVERISWEETQAWINKAGHGLRLPSEAEWEYSCRAGTQSRYCFGDDPGMLSEFAWFEGNSDNQTQAVASKKPNAFGLYDVHGNVWEWCQDRWPRDDSQGPFDHLYRDEDYPDYHVLRGGGFMHDARSCRSARSFSFWVRTIEFGFRLVRGLDC